MSPSPSSTTVAFVTAVEAGHFETQAVRMIDSLRRWGGSLAAAPMYVVKPRPGASYATKTRDELKRLNVIPIRAKNRSRYRWFPFINKPVALLEAQRASDADVLVWVDADVLFVADPHAFRLPAGVDFSACATEKNIATSGPDDPYEPFWVAMCDAVGLKIDDLPWMTEHSTGQRIRAYFQAGIFACRRSSAFPQAYYDACHKLLDARIGLRKDGFVYHDQAAIGLVAAKLKLLWTPLPRTHNFRFNGREQLDADVLFQARLLHYHRALQPDWWPGTLARLHRAYPDVAKWLETTKEIGTDERSPLSRTFGKLLYKSRLRRHDRYLATCRIFPQP